MLIAMTTDGTDLSAPINPRFGRCIHFLLLDTETNESRAVINPGSQAAGGAGIAAAEFIVNQNVSAVLTGHVGPNAFEVLNAGGVKAYSNLSGTLGEAYLKYQSGNLEADAAPTSQSHAGQAAPIEAAAPAPSTRRIAVSAEGEGLDAPCGAHFGRCPFFVLVDVRGETIIAVQNAPNPFAGNHQPGQVPTFIHSQNANVMLSGGMGARAVSMFSEMGIEVATGASGTVGQAITAYLKGHIQGSSPCTDHSAGCH